jgi:hypothetical protein
MLWPLAQQSVASQLLLVKHLPPGSTTTTTTTTTTAITLTTTTATTTTTTTPMQRQHAEHMLTVFMGDNSRQAAEVVALALHHTAHPDVIIQVETQRAVVPDWPASMPCSLKLPQDLQ